MEENTNQQNEQSGFVGSRRTYLIHISKCVLGIVLLILGAQAVRYTSEQRSDTFGPSYYIGAFIVGCADIVAGLVGVLVYCRHGGSFNTKEMSQYVGVECLLTVIAIIGGFIGIFFAAVFGMPECEPSHFGGFCNYTVNISENRSIATAILVVLIVSEILNIGSIIVQCNEYNAHFRSNRFRTRFSPQQYPLNSGDTSGINYGNVVVTAPPPETGMHVREHGRHRDYEGFSRDRQLIVDGNVMDVHGGGFSGAIIQPPPVTVIHPPTAFPQYSDQPNQSHLPQETGAHGYTANVSVSELQEQNRLLREQIALQQQQMELQEEHTRSPSPAPPPPSYESCLKDPSQDQNRKPESERFILSSEGHMMVSHNSENVQPSAPSL